MSFDCFCGGGFFTFYCNFFLAARVRLQRNVITKRTPVHIFYDIHDDCKSAYFGSGRSSFKHSHILTLPVLFPPAPKQIKKKASDDPCVG